MKSLFLACSIIALAVGSAFADGNPVPFPHPTPVHPVKTVYVSCESNEYALHYCTVPGLVVRAQVARQNSFAGCNLGSSFGYQGRRVWVKDGCRATFAVTYRL